MTTFADLVQHLGGAPVGGQYPIAIPPRKMVFVDGVHGSTGGSGSANSPFSTVQAAVDLLEDNYASQGVIVIAPDSGGYVEAVTISRVADSDIILFGLGGRGAVFIAPTTTNAVALTNHTDDVTLINVGCDGDGTGAGLINTGSRLRAYGCKLEGDDIAAQMTLGTVAQEAAGTRGVGADCLLFDCETAWASQGLLITCTDYGALTQLFLRRCKHANHSAASIDESVGSGGSAAVMFRNLEISDGVFDDLEDGTAPTAFILLNDDNGNTGIVTRCSFPTAINSGDNLVSTALHWVCNYHTGGVSTGQPS